MSQSPALSFDGDVSGIACGERPSGLKVGRVDPGAKVHLLPPPAMAFAPMLFGLTGPGIEAKHDGRIVLDQKQLPEGATLIDVVDRIDVMVAARDRGGLREGEHGKLTIHQCRDGWAYRVKGEASHRPSLKRIGTATSDLNNTFIVAYTEREALEKFLGRVNKDTQRDLPDFPEIPGVTIRRDGDVLTVFGIASKDEREQLLSVQGARVANGNVVLSTRYAKGLVEALAEIRVRRETAEIERRTEEASWAAAWRSAPVAPTKHVQINESAGTVRVSFGAYIDDARELLARAGAPKWDATHRHWILKTPDIEKLRASVDAAEARLNRVVEQKETEKREKQAVIESRVRVDLSSGIKVGDILESAGTPLKVASFGRSWTENRVTFAYAYTKALAEDEVVAWRARKASEPRIGTTMFIADLAPVAGQPFRSGDAILTATWVGNRRFMDSSRDDVNSMVSSTFWEQWVVDVRWREATSEEIDTHRAKEAARNERKELARRIRDLRDLRDRIFRDGDVPDLGQKPSGLVLLEEIKHLPYGMGDWLILDDEGRLWTVSYRGGDGDAWMMGNLGQNTHGRCLTVTDDEIEALRRHAELTGFKPYRRENDAGPKVP
jgi:hypothetical protein